MVDMIFNSAKRDLLNGSIDLDTDTIKVMLVTSAYVPNQDTHTERSDVTNEVTGTNQGSTAGGATPANNTDHTDNEWGVDAGDVA